MKASTFSLANDHLERIFTVTAGRLATESFTAHGCALANPDGTQEAVVTIGGTPYSTAADAEHPLSYLGHTLTESTQKGHLLEVRLQPGSSGPDFEVTLQYRLPPGLPVLQKSLRVHNTGTDALELDGAMIEAVDLRTDGEYILLLENDYVRAGQTGPDGHTRSPWVEHIRDYVGEIIDPPAGVTTFAYPHKLGRVLQPGEVFTTFSAYAFAVSNQSLETRGLDFRAATRALLPWTRDTLLPVEVAPASRVEELYESVDSAAEAGYGSVYFFHGWIDGDLISPLFSSYADYIPRADLFPGGWADIRKLTDYAHEKGLKTGFYAIYVSIWDDVKSKAVADNQWQLEFAPEDGSQRWGTSMCPASDWGGYINRKILDAIERGGFDGIALDGPYYGDVCISPQHGHAPGGSSQALAWQRQAELYESLKAHGKTVFAAQGFCAFFHGLARVGQTGYDEGDFGQVGLWEQVLNTRRGAYEWTRIFRQEQGVFFIPGQSWLSGPCLEPYEQHVAEYNAYLANCFGYGFDGAVFQRVSWDGPKSRAVLERWIGFWKRYEAFFKRGYLLHVQKPDGVNPDAVLHVLPEEGRALLVAFNPADTTQHAGFDLPFGEVGLPNDGWKSLDAACTLLGASASLTIPPRDAVWAELTLG